MLQSVLTEEMKTEIGVRQETGTEIVIKWETQVLISFPPFFFFIHIVSAFEKQANRSILFILYKVYFLTWFNHLHHEKTKPGIFIMCNKYSFVQIFKINIYFITKMNMVGSDCIYKTYKNVYKILFFYKFSSSLKVARLHA